MLTLSTRTHSVFAAFRPVWPALSDLKPRHLSNATVCLSPQVEEFARQTATAVRLGDLYRWGTGDFNVRLNFARFLQKEVAIRNAQLCKELSVLPFGLAESDGVRRVIGLYSGYVEKVVSNGYPDNIEEDDDFSKLLGEVLEDSMSVVWTIGSGVTEVRGSMKAESYECIRSEVDHILDRLFMKRIGLRFLLQHYLEARDRSPGVSGIIHSHVRVGEILRSEAQEAMRLCQEKYGHSPSIYVGGDDVESDRSTSHSSVEFAPGREFTYVPIHLRMPVSVILQNACYSVAASRSVDVAGSAGEGHVDLPPVRVVYAYTAEGVGVKVSDEGGGIPRSKQDLAWSYFCTPTSPPGLNSTSESPSWRHSAPLGSGNPRGAGLPLARLHARYYGGDLVLKSIEGFGTDAHLFLHGLGFMCESLPPGVRVSPAMRDSSLGEKTSFEALGANTKAEALLLREKLAEFRKETEPTVLSFD